MQDEDDWKPGEVREFRYLARDEAPRSGERVEPLDGCHHGAYAAGWAWRVLEEDRDGYP